MNSIEDEKRQARIEGEKKRGVLSREQRTIASGIITRRVLARPEVRKAKTVCVYVSFGNEVDTKIIIRQLLLDHKVVVSPESKNNNVDVFLVPGVIFDRKRNRVGRGKGFYDRLLDKTEGYRIGLAFDCQVVAEVPHTGYDIPMHCVITQKEEI